MSTTGAPYAGASRRVKARLDALVDRARTLLGHRYFHGLMVGTGVLVVTVTVPLQNITQIPFYTGGFGEWWYVGIFAGIAAAAGPLVLMLVVVPRHRAVIAYLRGEEVDPAHVWRDCVTRPAGTAAMATLVWGTIAIVVGVAIIGRREDFGAAAYAGALANHALILLGVGAFYLMVWELALLPIAREVAKRLPSDFAETSRVSGRRRLMLLNTAITFTVGSEAAGLSIGFAHHGSAWVVVLVTLGLVSMYVGVLLSLVASNVSRRVDELADALSGVVSGLDSIRILPTSGDEFDTVGRAFNRMVDLLNGHADELMQSRARLAEVADGTRRGIERDLHDGAQQNLALVSMQLGQLETGCASLPVAPRVRDLRGELSAVVAEMRALAHGIYPASLEAEGIASALRAAARESEVMVTLDLAVPSRWSHAVESAVYFCCWEVLQRARQATADEPTVRIALHEQAGLAVVELSMRPPLAEDQAADLALSLQDRLGAVGGRLATAGQGDHAVLRGEVPTW